MKRYIRLEWGKIIDTTKIKTKGYVEEYNGRKYFYGDEYIAESDEITDLVFDEDLVKVYDNILNKTYFTKNEDVDIESYCFELLAFYTKQGNNYILVWTKERGVI